MRLILHYTKPGDIVLDGFCGTGMTGVAAQMCGTAGGELRTTIELEMGNVAWELVAPSSRTWGRARRSSPPV